MAASASILAQKLPRESRTPPADDPSAFRVLCWATLSIAAAVMSIGVVLHGSKLIEFGFELAAWGGLILAAEISSIPLRNGFHITFGLPLLLAAGFIYGPLPAGILAFAFSVDLRELKREISMPHALFNRAQISLCVIASAYVFQAAQTTQHTLPRILLPAFLALATDMTVNSIFVALGGRLKHGLRSSALVESVTLGEPRSFAAVYTAYGFLAVFFSVLFWAAGSWALLAFAAPVLLGREVFSRSKRLGDVQSQLQLKDQALQDASSKIGEERRDERIRIASSLHDDVLQSLYNVTLHAQVLREDLRTGRLLELEEDMPQLLEATESTSTLLRQVIQDLRQSPLARGGLIQTLNLLIKQIKEEANIEILAHLEENDLEPSQQLLVYQVTREALLNAVHHSGADVVKIALSRESDAVRVRVQDNGKGFWPESVDSTRHFGLQLMRERAHIAGGDLYLESVPGRGTEIIARFPCKSLRRPTKQ